MGEEVFYLIAIELMEIRAFSSIWQVLPKCIQLTRL